MRLNDPLITSFEYEGTEYEINLAFDNVLDVFDVIKIPYLHPFEKAKKCLEYLLVDETLETETIIELWNFIFETFIEFEEKKPIQYDLKGNPMPTEEDEDEEEYSDIEQDAEYIYASFRQAYGINLFQEQGKMQWSEFKALLHGLPNNTVFRQIMQIRAWEPSKHDTPETKKEMEKLKRIHALKEVE
ncbi:Gp15 family bacteriophage protein [Oceanobacillus alkalisoli]|uniref:Gp15 family bacteriophage protein n=1 Tax=Oceanobacillus alkalisoli TaxID=2925113 RepID=UPI001EF06934|nr:Gp15 family bacteriophage protein [Oceanobacillus alkalisoli]MCF3942213.1 bacteriophage Gp15 family protein [Oceanobacillus alkalisoli]MCG5104452.1 bacteriophage Gp15 family protein [Oceanobacillus alkalisoli]